MVSLWERDDTVSDLGGAPTQSPPQVQTVLLQSPILDLQTESCFEMFWVGSNPNNPTIDFDIVQLWG